ncbi:NAD-dependent epimerase/dehydratase family protein [Symbiopectobacterium purcellii]|uniref:NAD-dependent epimerase/dehydratase family protein n=1 Tax=Symbiopectobacterium purcellii TaxID=2871826 RepID=A0ABX9AVH7_9ENTR|nr:NAD-dependent epimerase/dehydratase family protein [Symbiopectobacterium purcellii]QZN97434.1 NAD-dependent epimerase/dehydratase family protein [Symbiopectobacterium purcellii]
MDKILITGGAGYIGSHVVEILLMNNKQVRVLDNGMFGLWSLYPFHENPNFELVEGDLRNISDIKKSVRNIDGVIHLGGIVGNPACSYDKLTCQDVNVIATERLAAASSEAGVSRFIFASSCSVYGFGTQVFTEDSALNPVDYYAESKIAGEEVLKKFKTDMIMSTCRFATVFGASRRMRFDLAVNGMTASALYDGVCHVHGGAEWRPFIHCHDIAIALCKISCASENLVRNQVFNIGSDDMNITLAELGYKIGKLIKASRVEINDTLSDNRSYQVSFKKIRECLGFTSKVSINEGIVQIKNIIESHIIPIPTLRIYSNLKTTEQLVV